MSARAPSQPASGAVSARAGLAALALVTLVCVPWAAAEAATEASGREQIAGPAQVVRSVATDQKVVALTFDAGSDAGHTQVILDILREQGVRATFFLTGQWIDSYPDLAQAIASGGHDVGNHTYTHPHMTGLDEEEIQEQLTLTEDKAVAVSGRSLKPYYRPPFGEHDDRVGRLAAAEGYPQVVMWSVDSMDWKTIPADELVSRVVDNVAPGGIVLMHVGSQTNEPEALPRILGELARKGYRFVTLSELLALAEPAGGTVSYTVAPGDTLSSIARRYHVSVSSIIEANAIRDPDTLQAGAVLIIPVAGGSGGNPPSGGDPGTGGPGPGEDQGGWGKDDPGGNQGSPRGILGWLARTWTALNRFWGAVWGLLRRLVPEI